MKKIIFLSILFIIISINVNADLTTDNILYYSLDDSDLSGSNPLDSSIEGNDGTNNGATIGSTGIINEGFTFDSVGEYVSQPNIIPENSAFTFNVWVKPDFNLPDNGYINLAYLYDGSASDGDVNVYFQDLSGAEGFSFGFRGTTTSARVVKEFSTLSDWIMITLIYDGGSKSSASSYDIYFDSVLYTTGKTMQSVGGSHTSSRLGMNEIDQGTGNYILEEYSLYDIELTQNDIDELYNSGTGFNPYGITNEAPVLNLLYPISNDHLNDDPIQLYYNISDEDDDLINCTIRVNNSIITTTTNINTTINYDQYYNITKDEGQYNWNVTCTDGTVTVSSQENFIIDRTNPDWTINSVNTDNTSIFDRSTINHIYFNDTLDDTYLFAYSITSYYPNGTIWFNDNDTGITLEQYNYTRNESITSTQSNGTYTINYYAEDDHTAKWIEEMDYEIKSDSIIYNTPTTNVSIKTLFTVEGITTQKLDDRYTFAFDTQGTKGKWSFELSSDKKLWYRENLYDYPVFVTGKQWVDFNIPSIPNVKYNVQYKNDYLYEIEIEIEEEYNTIIEFESLGGLNIVNETYTFQIKENSAPTITNTTPNQYFEVDDGSYTNFTTIATDFDNDTLTYYYYWNGLLDFTGQNLLNFFLPYNSHGINNMTVIVSDGGKTDSYTWDVNITHNPVYAYVVDVDRIPLTTWYSNIENTYITCEGLDPDNETQPINWGVEIEYKTGILWHSLIPEYVSGNDWRAHINISTLQGETISSRCRVMDEDDWSDYVYDNSFVTVQEPYVMVGNVTSINPSGVNRNFVTSVTCNPSNYGSVKSNSLKYDIDAYYNSEWHNISYDYFDKVLFDMSTVDYGESVKFRCRVDDGISVTDYLTGENVNRTHITDLFMYNKGGDEVLRSNTPYYKGLMVDLYNEHNVSINSVYVDCNGDTYWDYFIQYNDSRNVTKEDFKCVNTNGLIKHTIGVFINKTGTNNKFCSNSGIGLCQIERTYEVLIK